MSTKPVDNLLTDLIRQSVAPLAQIDIPGHAKVLDVGSGAGLPALPLKFARQDLQVTMLEPRRKKYLFLNRVIEELGLDGILAVRSRLEEICDKPEWQGEFDLITTRGTGSAADLFPLAKGLIRPGGMCWFYKGRSAGREQIELSALCSGEVRLLELEKGLSLIVVPC